MRVGVAAGGGAGGGGGGGGKGRQWEHQVFFGLGCESG